MIGTNIFLTSIFYIISIFLGQREPIPVFNIEKQNSALNFKKNIVRHTTFGQQRLISSFLWIQTMIESDLEHYKGLDLGSWMFIRFDHITDLDPKFLEAYQYGLQYLSVVKDDIPGATSILEKGILIYPHDFILNLAGGFHYLNEEQNPDKALERLLVIKDYPKTPPFVPGLIAKIQANQGELKDALLLLEHLYENAPKDSPFKEKYERDLYALNAQIDLECLNNSLENCKRVDFKGSPYIYRDGNFVAKESWAPLKLFKRP